MHVVGLDPRNDFKFRLNYCVKYPVTRFGAGFTNHLRQLKPFLLMGGEYLNESYKMIY